MTNVTDVKPGKDFEDIKQKGLKALKLIEGEDPAFLDRLPENTVSELSTALTALGVLVPGARTVRHQARTATVTQAEALASGFALVSAVRTAAIRRSLPAAVRKAYGVGAKTNPKVVGHVTSGIDLILERAQAMPDEARTLGLTAADLTALGEAKVAILGADETQEGKRAASPLTTKQRNLTSRRILAAVDHISTAGILHHARNPVKRAQYEALLAGPKRAATQPGPTEK
jgi:hypothetical protein